LTELTITVRGLEEVQALLRRFPQVVEAETRNTMRKSVDHMQEQVSGRTPVNTGALRGSIGTHITGSLVGGALVGRVSTSIPYAEPVEFGRKKGKMPPVDAIEMWVVRKGIARGEDTRSVAFVIARAIGRRGTKGRYMFRDGFDAGKDRVIRLWDSLLDNVLGRLG